MKHSQVIQNKELTSLANENPEFWLRTIFRRNGIECSDDQFRKLNLYVNLLLDWNKRINLISRRDVENVWVSHILHSLSPLFLLKIRDEARVVDLGTGGGLPGIPLKIFLPKVSMVLVDSTKKKITAVQSMINSLGLPALCAIWGRAEDLGKDPELHGQFDHAVARGVAPLADLVKLSAPLLKASSDAKTIGSAKTSSRVALATRTLVAYKGGMLEEEVRRIQGKTDVKGIRIMDLSFAGSERLAAGEKKLVVVHL